MSRKKKTYLEWVAEYPNYVVIRLEGYFYTVKYEAAELIGEICGYNIGLINEAPITGSPICETMEEALIDNCINYIIIENERISAIREFSTSDFRYAERDINKTGRNKKFKYSTEELVDYLDAILNSVDPENGEIFGEEHVINSEKMQEILIFTYKTLSNKIERQKNKPEKAGAAWTEEESEQLKKEFEQKLGLGEIAKNHKRSKGAISSQLLKLYPELLN